MRVWVAIALVGVGCSPGAFTCEDPGECLDGGVAGTCQPDGFCSFPDPQCPSGQRYGAHSGALSRECVPPAGGTETGSGTSGSPSTTMLDATSVSASASSFEDSVGDSDPDTTFAMTTAPGTSTGVSMEESTGEPPIGPDLALWLRFEDASFPAGVADDGPWQLPATCEADSCPASVAGYDGKGAEFTGSDQCIVVPHAEPFDGLAAMTVSVFVRIDASNELDNHMVVGKRLGMDNNNSFELYFFDHEVIDPAMQARFAISDEAASATVAGPELIPAGEWVHLAGVWDGAAVGLWVDGVQVASGMQPTMGSDQNPVLVGCDDDPTPATYDNVFVGVIDEVRIYREALTPEQIAALAAGGEP